MCVGFLYTLNLSDPSDILVVYQYGIDMLLGAVHKTFLTHLIQVKIITNRKSMEPDGIPVEIWEYLDEDGSICYGI